ncbi:MAG: toprim domain-containing protein [Bdellovibrionales bacterium]
MRSLDLKEIKLLANGRWFEILNSHGIAIQFLNGKNGPCPICGGNDRWRWDNKNGDGGGLCHQCDLRGSGLSILGRWLNLSSRKDFPKLLEIIANTIRASWPVVPRRVLDEESKCKYMRSLALKLWHSTQALAPNDTASVYLKNRGLTSHLGIKALRSHPNLEYRKNGKIIGKFPALVAKVTDVQGKFLAIHRTFLDPSGAKANVTEVKMMLGPVDGGSVQFDHASEVLNIAEGIETALAVRELSGGPTWAAMTAGNLEKLEIPNSVKKVTIWADLDPNKRGEKAAHALARRLYHLGVQTIIKLPEAQMNTEKLDWLDIHLDQSGSPHVG